MIVKRRIYLDSSVLIAIAEGEAEIAERALAVLDDPNDRLEIVLSEAVRLEVVPERLRRPEKHGQKAVIDELFLRAAAVVDIIDKRTWDMAIEESTTYWMQALDALHAAAARAAGAEEMLTAEKPEKAICKTQSLRVWSARDGPTAGPRGLSPAPRLPRGTPASRRNG